MPFNVERVGAATIGLLALLLTTAAAVPVPGTDGRVRLTGWLDGLAVAPTIGGPTQRPQLAGALLLDARYRRRWRAHVETKGRIGGPFMGGPGIGAYDFTRTFQNYTPSVEFAEAWAELRTRRVDVRAGLVRVAWGKLDGIPPSDVVNPRDYHDPIVDDFEERKIGIPMLHGTYHLPDVGFGFVGLRLGLLWVPIPVPSRLPLALERWFPTSTEPPARFDVSSANVPGFTSVRVDFGTANDAPPRALDDGGIGARFGGTWRSVDWDLYHYTGPWTGPDADLVPVLVPQPSVADPTAITRLVQAHDAIHMTAGAMAFPLGVFTVRGEVAHFIDKPYLAVAGDLVSPEALADLPLARIARRLQNGQATRVTLDPLFPDLDSVEWGIGVDTVWHGFQPILQVNQVVLLESAPRLLIGDPDTRFAGTVRKHLLDERLELEVRGQYAVERGDWFLFPRVSYLVLEGLRVRVGYLALGGPRASIYGQYGQNDEVVLQARYSF